MKPHTYYGAFFLVKSNHPLLLLGPRGVGKSFSVEMLVRDLFCIGTKTSDCTCTHCLNLKANQILIMEHYKNPVGKDIPIASVVCVQAGFPGFSLKLVP